MFTFRDGGIAFIPGLVMLLPAIPIAFWIWRRSTGDGWKLLAFLALVHITAVVALTLFPIPVSGQDFYRHARGMSEDNIVPFATIISQLTHPSLSSARQLGGNMLALAPLGIYAPALWPALRDPRRFILVAVAFAVGIELAQYTGSFLEGFTYRVTDVDDAIMNASGAVIAFFVWRRLEVEPVVETWLRRFDIRAESA